MKRLTVVLMVTIVAILALPALAQQASGTPPADATRSIDKASPKLMTGKVTQVDQKTRAFTLVAKGKEYRFVYAQARVLPKVGDVLDVTYTGDPGSGPVEATNLNLSRSNSY